MKHVSTGFGLCVAAAAALAYPFVSSLAPNADASAVTAAAVSTSATGRSTPVIVWYGLSSANSSQAGANPGAIFRAWSDGRIEYRLFGNCWNCQTSQQFTDHDLQSGPWKLFSDPAQGLTYRSDINFDERVDGADLGQLLADWGDSPRQDIPPSDCPLVLINP